jgi:hypothetical protein
MQKRVAYAISYLALSIYDSVGNLPLIVCIAKKGGEE